MRIRPYTDDDHGAFCRALKLTQDEDRARDPWLAPGDAIIGDYLTALFEDIDGQQGAILVAEDDSPASAKSPPLGFVAVLGACQDYDIDEIEHVFGFITDLVVEPGADRVAVTRSLLAAAEQHVANCGTDVLRASLLADNDALQESYAACGFSHRLIQVEKRVEIDDE